MGKDILTPNKIQSYAERDYSTPKAHCDLDVMQKAEQVNTISKINPDLDEDVLAMMDEKSKMYKEGVLSKPKQRSRNQEWTDIERQLIKKAGDGYFDKRGHRRNLVSISNKDGETEYIVNTSLLAEIVGMHPLIRGVHTLVTVCNFHKSIYQKISTSKTSARKAITKKQLQQIAEVLSLEDWKTLIDTKAHEMREIKRRETIKTKMKDYKDQIKQLEKEIKDD
tara:strand:- start:210 stop:878 length:669 start_codon:yes stop_codon:yes gene_type:complete